MKKINQSGKNHKDLSNEDWLKHEDSTSGIGWVPLEAIVRFLKIDDPWIRQMKLPPNLGVPFEASMAAIV